ncbi:NADP-dependent isocitrate dehydrogenase [Bryobacter aggregatus]|uniref:NADP-dependent isocitrate dehydrogenase n=1 Tax=Bryobacter aggregatus TaxID=360054 RepID=UPI0004E157B6|nr:NADP-dependent isocitrate dehydrogenase [Bryobacter aggregatus]
MAKTPITVAHGDGIGPEIMAATLHILEAAGAQLDIETIEIGEKVYLRGNSTGIDQSSIDSLLRTKVFLKAPITTPQGGGFKSLNVTTRKMLGLYANVRPCVAYHPFVQTKHQGMDVVIVRENEEDLYAGIEYQLSADVTESIKLISRRGTERIVRYAFEYAKANGRKKVTCFTKDNIMKISDGLFHKIFDELGAEYPEIEKEHWIVDIGAAKLADTPGVFDVIVMPNLYGDILSDVAAQIAGSVGLAGSSNIGMKYAMFEAIHGSAPRRAGQNLANPSGLLLGGVMMLAHIGQPDVAQRVHNAWLKTLEDGTHTYDIFKEGVSKTKVGTKEFADAVVANVGKLPQLLKPVEYKELPKLKEPAIPTVGKTETAGIDIFINWTKGNASELGPQVEKLSTDKLKFVLISSRGTKVYPIGSTEAAVADQWRCRFEGKVGELTQQDTAALYAKFVEAGFSIIKTEGLFYFDGQRGYSLSQGQ